MGTLAWNTTRHLEAWCVTLTTCASPCILSGYCACSSESLKSAAPQVYFPVKNAVQLQ